MDARVHDIPDLPHQLLSSRVRSVRLDRVHSPTHRTRAGGGDPGTAAVPLQSGMRHGGWAAWAPLLQP
eukprot:scaffold27859_cov109-Isochrysis_galbana.AAC.4